MKKLNFFLTAVVILFSLFTVSCGQERVQRSRYEIECELIGNVLYGKEEVQFYNHSDNAFVSLKFNLFANAFRKGAKFSPIAQQYDTKAYYAGKNYGEIKINQVKNDKSAQLDFAITGEDENVLEVYLTEEVFPEEWATVYIEYEMIIPEVIARTGINRSTINLANFYPILCGIEDESFYECVYYANGDPYYSDCADYKVTFTCDETFVVASTGKIDSMATSNNKKSSCYSIENARSFCLVLSKEFEMVSEQVNGVEVNYYFYKDAYPHKSLKYAVDSMKYFDKAFGKYPYQNYSIVQTEFIQGGMEFPALVMISDELEEKAYGEVIVHETAHQWWQTTVGNNEIQYGFLDEGLAEYSVVLFYENHPEYGLKRQTLIESSEKTYKIFCSVYDKLFGNVDTSMMRSLKDFSSEYEYVNIAYVKPCIMYDNLRKTMGDEKFFSALKSYYGKYSFSNASPDCLVAEFEKQVKDVAGYFYSFFDGKVII